MVRIILIALLAWFLYNLVFRFIIPVYKSTQLMKKKFREMQDQMNAHQNAQPGQAPSPEKKPDTKISEKDYIDFEEIK